MSTATKIEWTRSDDGTAGATWNPVTGCTKVSAGCDHCYAETFAERWRGIPGHPFEQGFDVRLWPGRLEVPLRRRKPTRYFVNSMSDLWHDAVGVDFLARVFAVMALADRHTFQVLTKRPGRMHSVLASGQFWGQVRSALGDYGPASPTAESAVDAQRLPNLWLGVSVESQKWAAVRLDKLAATTAGAVRFASCEPLLGPLDLRPWLGSGLDWVIAGGESGPRARPMHPAWVRSLRDQCEGARVPYFFKQRGQWTWDRESGQPGPRVYVCAADGRVAGEQAALADCGSWAGVWRVGKGRAGRLLDGRTWDEFPHAAQAGVLVS
jgi:protein gp37